MIVDPDFTEHWKTRMLVGLLDGDEAAPVYVIRLWSHCQNRRQDKFDNLTPEALKALCRFPGNANKLESSLATSGFIRRHEKVIEVLNWADYNSSLLAAWENGRKGGRPAKPMGKPTGKPTGSRVDKSREDSINTNRINTDSSAVGLPTTEPNSDDVTLLVFPCVGSPNHWNLTKSMVQKWQGLYPTVDVMDECRRALAWCDANTSCRKTSRGMPKFFVGWLNRASDSKSRKTSAPANQYLTKIQQQEANMAAVLERARAADLAQENGEEFSFFRLTSEGSV